MGTLALRADDPALFLEYRNQPDQWRDAHRGGWYLTGNLASRDADGYLWYIGRQDDLFKSRGYLIAPKEIEDAILEHPAVVEAAVVGQPDAEVGQRIAAFVVLAPGVGEHPPIGEEIRATVRACSRRTRRRTWSRSWRACRRVPWARSCAAPCADRKGGVARSRTRQRRARLGKRTRRLATASQRPGRT